MRRWTSDFGNPEAVAIGPHDDNVYVADTENDKIQKFFPNGTKIGEWNGTTTSNTSTTFHPTAVAVDASGNVFVVDSRDRKVKVFNDDGSQFIAELCEGIGPRFGKCFDPSDVTVSSDGTGFVYISDNVGGRRILKARMESGGLVTYEDRWRVPAGNGLKGLHLDSWGRLFVTIQKPHYHPGGRVLQSDESGVRLTSLCSSEKAFPVTLLASLVTTWIEFIFCRVCGCGISMHDQPKLGHC